MSTGTGNRRVVLAGNNLAAVATLELILQRAGAGDVLVIAPEADTAPWHVSLAAYAGRLGVPCLVPDDVNDEEVVTRVEEHGPDLLLSVYYTQIFRPRLLDAVSGPALNFHPSLLPRHRGVAPLIWAIIEGDRSTGLTVHHIDDGIDTGRIVVQRSLPIHDEDTGYRLHLKMARLVRATAAELLRAYFVGEAIPSGGEQSGVVSYHSSSDPRVNHIDWASPRRRIRDIVRALAPPLPGAFVLLNGEPIVLARVDPLPHVDERRTLTPGMVELRRGEPPVVWALDGPLQLSAFVDGKSVVPGEELPLRRSLLAGQVLA